jgi:hypothetical protein
MREYAIAVDYASLYAKKLELIEPGSIMLPPLRSAIAHHQLALQLLGRLL